MSPKPKGLLRFYLNPIFDQTQSFSLIFTGYMGKAVEMAIGVVGGQGLVVEMEP